MTVGGSSVTLRSHKGPGQPPANDFLFPSPTPPNGPAPMTLEQHLFGENEFNCQLFLTQVLNTSKKVDA